MHIAILQCDEVQDKFVVEYGTYLTMFSQLLHQVDSTLSFSVYNAVKEELPEPIDKVDAYLITGSRHGVNDGHAWIAHLEQFIRHLHAAQKKLIGICFGHQLVAKALGGKVIKSPNGWGVGMSVNTIAQAKPWMQPWQTNLNLVVSHQDQVVELPPETEILAHSDFCRFYMLQINQHFFTVQGHPEFSQAYSRALIDDRKTVLGALCWQQGLDSLQMNTHDKIMAQWMVHFLKQ